MTASLHSAEAVGTELSTRLAACTTALGAETDLGAKVYRGRRHVDDTMIPCCVVIEGDDVPARGNVKTDYRLDQRYVLFAYVPCDPDHPNDAAHAAIRDMKRALFNTNGVPDSKLGGKARDVEYLGRDIGPRADGAAFVLAALEVGVEYAENVANP
jgi:hypothetical protein